jgi:hypothetical protein
MRQLAITFAVMMLIGLAGALASNAQAATLAGVGNLPALQMATRSLAHS